jgi:hypothetical protein
MLFFVLSFYLSIPTRQRASVGSRLPPSQRKDRLGENVGWPVCIRAACTMWVEGLEPNKTTAKKRGPLPINLV